VLAGQKPPLLGPALPGSVRLGIDAAVGVSGREKGARCAERNHEPISVLLCVVALSAGVGGSHARQASERFEIRRETESQARDRMMRALSQSNLLGRPISVGIRPDSIEEVFVPYGSFNRSDMELSDDAIRALFSTCTFISDDELHRNSLAPWKTLVIATDGNDRLPMELFLGGTLGTVTFDTVGEVAFKCAR